MAEWSSIEIVHGHGQIHRLQLQRRRLNHRHRHRGRIRFCDVDGAREVEEHRRSGDDPRGSQRVTLRSSTSTWKVNDGVDPRGSVM